MMFLQFFVWGAWFVTLGACLDGHGLGDIIGAAYGTAPLAAIVAPLFLGLVADRFFRSERVMGVLFLLGGTAMLLVPGFAARGDAAMVKNLLLFHMLCYMPTLGLGNAIAFAHISDQSKFPALRVWGTIGWIVSNLVVGFLGWSQNLSIFTLSGAAALGLGVLAFVLPATPPPAKGQPLRLGSLLMFDAFRLLGRPSFLVFIICSALVCVPLAFYFSTTSMFLSDMGFREPASSMSIGQMSEIVFMVLIPFFFRRLGVKRMILVAIMAWVLRYVLFAVGATQQSVWMMFAAIALHGICYDFFFVTGFMYADRAAASTIRGQVQGMLVFFTQGVGMFIGYRIADAVMKAKVPDHAKLADAIKGARTEETLSFAQQLGRMFSVELPAKLDAQLVATVSSQWRAFWLVPSLMAVVVAVIFALAFRDRERDPEQQ
jgi:nucleoside transporter